MPSAFAADLRWAFRLARRRPALAIAAVLTLSVTIAASAAVFGLATAVLWKPLPFADASRLVFVWEAVTSGAAAGSFRVTPARFAQWRRHNASFVSLSAFGAAMFTTPGPQGTLMVRGVRVTPDYFDTLGIAPALGRGFLPGEERPGNHRVVVLSHAFWMQRFGGRPDALGAALQLNGEPFTIIGVMPPVVFPGWPVNPATVTLEPDTRELWVPIQATPAWTENARSHVIGVLGRLRPGVTMEQAADDLNRMSSPPAADPHGAHLTAFRRQFVRDAWLPLVLLLATALAVLLVACANLAALQVSALESRRAELGIRSALGAGRGRLARQLATEALMLAGVGGVLGAALARFALAELPSLLPPAVPFLTTPSLDLRVAGFGTAIALLAGLILGAWPISRALAATPSPRGTMFAARGAVYRGLVVVQISLATALVVAAGLLAQSFLSVSGRDPGFVVDRVLVSEVTLSGPGYDTAAAVAVAEDRLIEAVTAVAGVRGAAVAYDHPLEANWMDSLSLIGSSSGADDVRWSAQLRIVSPSYFETMGVDILEGRRFTGRDDLAADGAMLVNEAFARRAGAERVLGRQVRTAASRLTWGDAAPDEFTIVGIVEDERFRGLEQPSEAAVYLSTRQFPQSGFVMLVRTAGDPLGSAADLRTAVRGAEPAAALSRITSLDAILSGQMVTRRVTTDVVGGLAGVALGLAALGMYGLLAMLVSGRTREIGVRLALGASPSMVARQVVGDSLRSAVAGIAIGILLALLTGRLIGGLLVGVSAADPRTIAVVALAFLVVAGVAAVLPALRASRVDPARALGAQ